MAIESGASAANDLSVTVNKLNLNPDAGVKAKPVLPDFIGYRIALYDKIKARQDALQAQKPRNPISVLLPDGRKFDAVSNQTTSLDIASMLGKSIAKNAVVAKVNGVLTDLSHPLEGDCSLEILDFDSEEGKQVFWHSSAHILGEACEQHYGCHLCLGPPIDDGFYYEMGMQKRAVVPEDYVPLEEAAKNIIDERQPFEKVVVTKEELLEMFKYNPYKVRLITDKVPNGTSTTVYRCGTLIDPCLGPHVPDTSRIKAFKVMKHSSSYFLGNAENDSLQRIYGISFPDQKMLKEHIKFLQEAGKRDHRKIGIDQELFFFHELSPGSCFWLPHGTRVYNTLLETMRAEYRKRGFTEVITPNVYNVDLWKTSGHWDNYRENMFAFQVEKESFALKPMNCPGHCLMFAQMQRSYRELPIRFADFGVLHRNELSGALSGLTRVRRFQQDDAHIFCTKEQLNSEISSCLDFLKFIYEIFGFQFSMKLSTRPEKFMGEIELWNAAEKQLEEALNASGCPWELNPGDGAFYGPKIDITIMDAHRRKHQCGTIQLDFQLPIRFGLHFCDGSNSSAAKNGKKTDDSVENGSAENEPVKNDSNRPVIIHRAILGSVERMTAILIENFGNEWPFWLSPRQIMIVPVSHASDDYAKKVHSVYHDAGFYVDTDVSDVTLNKKIRNAEIAHHNFVIVVGAKEEENGTVNIRRTSPEEKDIVVSIEESLKLFQALKQSKSRSRSLSQ